MLRDPFLIPWFCHYLTGSSLVLYDQASGWARWCPPKEEMSAWKQCTENLHCICAMWAVAPSRWKHTKSTWRGYDPFCRNISSITFYQAVLTVTICPPAFLKKGGPIMPCEEIEHHAVTFSLCGRCCWH